VLTRLFRDRGVKLERTYQLNFGGNTDFLNMLERERLMSKKISKTRSVTSQLDYDIGKDNVHIGPSDYVPWLNDRKWAYIRLEGRSFGDVPLNVELKLEVVDSPNSAGIVIDAVRCAKLALDRGIGGSLEGPSSYFMKSPPVQYSDNDARRLVEEFIEGDKAGVNGREGRNGRQRRATTTRAKTTAAARR
jgi:myo-inositol-1-phosphate synthase